MQKNVVLDLATTLSTSLENEQAAAVGSNDSGTIVAVKEIEQQTSVGDVKIKGQAIGEVKDAFDKEGNRMETVVHKHFRNPDTNTFHAFELSEQDKITFREWATKGMRNHILAFHNTTTGMMYYKRFYVHEDKSITVERISVGNISGTMIAVDKSSKKLYGYSGNDAYIAQKALEKYGLDYPNMTDSQKLAIQAQMGSMN